MKILTLQHNCIFKQKINEMKKKNEARHNDSQHMETENTDIYTLTVTRRLKMLFNQFSCTHSLTRIFDEDQRMKLNPLNSRCNFDR